MQTSQLLTLPHIAKMLNVSDYYLKNVKAIQLIKSAQGINEAIDHLKYVSQVRKEEL
jgi:hypothetical protein